MNIADPATINPALLWALFLGLPVLALAVKVGALNALAGLALRKLVR